MTDSIYDENIVRKCKGWKDVGGLIHFSRDHTEVFIVPPLEHKMPDTVPGKVRCPSCQAAYKNYRTKIRVARYRLTQRDKEILDKYIHLYNKHKSGKVTLSDKILSQLKKTIIERGGNIDA